MWTYNIKWKNQDKNLNVHHDFSCVYICIIYEFEYVYVNIVIQIYFNLMCRKLKFNFAIRNEFFFWTLISVL